MSIGLAKRNALQRIFGRSKPLIGNVHCLPLPGTPRYNGEAMGDIVRRAVRDARNYASGGMDGLLIENHGDIPFLPPDQIGPEIIAAMAVIVKAVTQEVGLPFGINLLANAPIGAFGIAKATDARFIRVNQWVNAYVSNEGIMQGESARVLRYRKAVAADDVAIFADVHVKHGAHAIVADRPISEQASDVEFFDADVAIVTGNRTGDAVPDEEIRAVRSGTQLPMIAGSGVTPENVGRILSGTDGAIVGSSLKRDGVWWNEVETDRVQELVEAAEEVRARD